MDSREGPDQGLERFCAEAYPQLVGALAHQVGDRPLAQELAQEALVRVCERWNDVRIMRSPLGWAFRVGANLANSHFRRRAAERRARRRYGSEATIHRDADPADRLAVRKAMGTLTAKQREAVVLRYFLGLTTEQAAEALGSTPLAVRGLTHRAVAGLRSVLDVDDDFGRDADGA